DAGTRGYEAIWTLAAGSAQAVPFLVERLKPRKPTAEDAAIRKLIAELDANQFTVRQKATEALEKIGRPAAAALRETLLAQPPLEVRRRAEKLLEKLGGPGTLTPDELRIQRAVEALELCGKAEARKLLESLGQQTADALLGREARAALERLKQEQNAP